MTTKVGGLEIEISADSTKLTTGMAKAEKAISKLDTQSGKLKSSTDKAAKSNSNFGRSAGQASIQVQQMVGQVSGGVNPLIAFSQQAADLGIVLGAPLLGSVVGIAAAFGTMLLPSVFDSKTALEELEEVTERIEGVMVDGSTGVKVFSDSLLALSQRSKVLADVKIAQTISEASSQIKIATDEINESVADLSLSPFKKLSDDLANAGIGLDEFASKQMDLGNTLNDVNQRALVKYETSITALQKRFGLTREQAVRFASAIGEFQNNKGAIGVGALRGSLEDLSVETNNSNENLVKFTSDLIPLFQKVSEGVDITNELRKALSGVDGELKTDDSVTALNKIELATISIAQKLEIARTETEMGAIAAQQLAIAFSLGLTSVDQLPDSIRESVVALGELQQKQQEMAQEERDFESFNKALDAQIAAEMRAEERKAANKKASDEKFLIGLQERLMSESELINAEELTRLDRLKEISDEELSIIGGREAARSAIEADAAKQRDAIALQEKQRKLSYVSATFGNLATLMNTGSRKLFNIGKMAAKASAVVDGAMAVQKTMASVPYPFNIPLAIAQGAASAVQIRTINAQQFGGGGSGATSFSGGVPAVNTQSGIGAIEPQQPQRNVSINLQGSMFSADQVRSLIGQINEQIGDGVLVS